MEDVKDKTEVEVRMGIDSDEVEIVDEWMDVEVKESKGKGKEKDDGYKVMERENEKLKLKVKELEMKVSGLEEENEGVRERESRWRGFANNLRKKISRMSMKRGEDSDDDENESAMEYAFRKDTEGFIGWMQRLGKIDILDRIIVEEMECGM
ncbi:hypothetical protein L210DRAFT_3651360 [Boletus edulis BED1]|uniref:Uncharacterized protein n=1 Tax=Boletus edulis BED1 TaxID=1328754 RepID=A0AAD4G8L3_BOLED|nr:hypothetical protein L210DRAFT_3651360 [Boletus edulis BED1]